MEEEIENLVVIAPDGGWGWMVVLTAFFINFVVDGNNYSFGLYYDVLSKEFNIGMAMTAFMGSVMSAFMYFLSPFVSALLNKYDFRFVTMIGSILAASAYAISSFTTHQYAFIASYSFMLGTGNSMLYVTSIIMPNLYFTKKRSIAAGIGTSGSGFGSLVVPPIITQLLNHYGWRTTFRILIGVVLTAGVTTLTYRPLSPLKVIHKKNEAIVSYAHKNNFYEEDTWKQKCCPCLGYSNKYYPTTDIFIPVKEVQLQPHRPSRIVELSSDLESESINISDLSAPLTKRDIFKYNCLFCLYSKCFEHHTKPMYRDDIFFGHSMHLIPKFKQHAYQMRHLQKEEKRRKRKKHLLEHITKTGTVRTTSDMLKQYHMAVTRVTTIKENVMKLHCYCACHMSIVRALMTMFHLELFKSYAFILVVTSGFFFDIGSMIPFMYIVQRGRTNNISPEINGWFLATIGGASTIGRILSGIIANSIKMNVIFLICFPVIICGTMTLCSGIYMEIWYQFMYAAIFGLTEAPVVALRSVWIVKLFGLENLTNAYGLQFLVLTVSSLCGVPIAGYIFDLTNTYKYSFYMSGCSLLLSSVFVICSTKVRKWELRKTENFETPYLSQAGPS